MGNASLKVHSFATLSAVDGPGIRCTVFLSGCELRCAYCHNPDTWDEKNSTAYTIDALLFKMLRYVPYFGEKGGVTLSGGEPFLQAEPLLDLIKELRLRDIHVAIDTAGSVLNDYVVEILKTKPLLLLDLKMPDEERYEKYIGGKLIDAVKTLEIADAFGCEIWMRYVVIPTINDSEQDIMSIVNIANRYKNVTNITLLPYHTMGVSKYEALGIKYRFGNITPPTDEQIKLLNDIVAKNFKN